MFHRSCLGSNPPPSQPEFGALPTELYPPPPPTPLVSMMTITMIMAVIIMGDDEDNDNDDDGSGDDGDDGSCDHDGRDDDDDEAIKEAISQQFIADISRRSIMAAVRGLLWMMAGRQ